MSEDILFEFDKSRCVPNNYYDSFMTPFMILTQFLPELRYVVFFTVLLWFPIFVRFLHGSHHFNYG